MPFTGNTRLEQITTEANAARPASERPSALLAETDVAYLDTVGMTLVRGRPFGTHDDRTGAPVAIVNETLARQLWPAADPLGRRLSPQGPDGPWLEVVGIARDAKYLFLSEAPRPMGPFLPRAAARAARRAP